MTERLNGTELKTTYSAHLKFENIDFMQVIEPLEEHRYDWELIFTWRNLQLSAEVGLVNSFLGDLWLNVAKTRYFYSKIIFLFLIEIREIGDGKPLWMKIGFKQKPKQKRKLRKIMSDVVAIRHSEWRWQNCIWISVSYSFEKDKGGDKADPAIVCSKWREETLKIPNYWAENITASSADFLLILNVRTWVKHRGMVLS